MLFFVRFTLLFLCGIAVTLAHNSPVTDSPQLPQNISPEIVNELKDFIGLIPAAIIDEIVAEHLILDGDFRKALKYLRSTQFIQLQRQLQQIPEIIEILDFLHLTVVPQAEQVEGEKTTSPRTCELATPLTPSLPQLERAFDLDNVVVDVDADPSQLEIVLLDAKATPLFGAFSAYNLHSFSSFVAEVLQHLPRDRYIQMINAKRCKSPAFDKFYAALRGVQFRPMVQAAMQAPNLANVIKTLSGNAVDVKSLEPIAFQVISWGPAV